MSRTNVMESLVAEELERQLQHLPYKTARYIDGAEVAAYALNRLPALYATSKRGWQQQRQRGEGDLKQQVVKAVRQGIAVVQQDPLRMSVPLEQEGTESQTALRELKELLQQEGLSWNNLASAVEEALTNTMQGEITWRQRKYTTVNQSYDWKKHYYSR